MPISCLADGFFTTEQLGDPGKTCILFIDMGVRDGTYGSKEYPGIKIAKPLERGKISQH